MPGKVKVKIVAGRNLPVMDRSSDTTDAYVELKLGNATYKTDVCRKSLNPQWNSEWYRFEVDDAELQDEPLQIRLMDHDTYSANDAIGKVYLDLNPLLLPAPAKDSTQPASTNVTGSTMSGWLPVYDTMHGIRGEVNVIVKVELFSDFNKFRQSSCGVQFFCSPVVPQGYHIQVMHGFVEELVVNDDPEYQWIDKIRTPRASNEARQTLFLKLSGEVQRKIGLKALDLGGNAVLGYNQCFDLERESGIVARGIGTAVSLIKLHDSVLNHSTTDHPESATSLACPAPDPVQGEDDTLPSSPGPPATPAPAPTPTANTKYSQSPAKVGGYTAGAPTGILTGIHRRSSDSDLSITPKGNSLTGSDRSSVTGAAAATHPNKPAVLSMGRPPAINQENVDMLEYPFLTMSKYPANFIVYIGGNVSSRSVKLLQRNTNQEEPETRDAWWKEIRMEVRSHARALGCNVVLGYSESTSICDDVCVLSASGTAAVINMQVNHAPADDLIAAAQEQQQQQTPPPPPPGTQNPPNLLQRATNRDRVVMTTSLDRNDFERERLSTRGDTSTPMRTDAVKPRRYSDGNDDATLPPCMTCHVPYNESSVPFTIRLRKCAVCRRGKVPDVLFATIEPPDIPVTGRGCLMQAYVCRPKRDCKGELNAKEISDGLPFLEYELHRLLVNKLRVKGMNAIFGLKVNVSIGERMLVGLATGTAVYLTALPPPAVPTITAGNSWKDDTKLAQVQRTIQEAVKRNRELYRLKPPAEIDVPSNGCRNPSDTEESEDELQDLDLATGNKDTCVLEVDDNEDVDVISLLMDPAPPEGFLAVNVESVPGLDDMEAVRNVQMFTQVWRAKVVPGAPLSTFSRHFHRVLQSAFFKLRRTVPCALSKLEYRVQLPEADELQLCLLGMAIGLGEADKIVKFRRKPVQSSNEGDLIFSLEEDVSEEASGSSAMISPPTSAGLPKPRNRSPHRGRLQNATKLRHTPPRERYGVDLTPLSYIPGGKIERYLGNVNFFLIRESTAIKESGGLSGFVHSFMAEVLAIVRAHVTALGGNAMVAYFISENVLFHNAHKNQGQCLINVGGDVVLVSYSGS